MVIVQGVGILSWALPGSLCGAPNVLEQGKIEPKVNTVTTSGVREKLVGWVLVGWGRVSISSGLKEARKGCKTLVLARAIANIRIFSHNR